MSERKKRMIVVVILVVVCSVIIAIWSMAAQKEDESEYEKMCRQYVGEWQDDGGDFILQVRRVSSAHMVVSIQNKKTKGAISYIAAVATTGDEYDFTYDAKKMMAGDVQISDGTKYSGNLKLQDNTILVNIPKALVDKPCLEYQGTLKKKTKLENGTAVHLQDYMGKTEDVPDEMEKCSSIERNSQTHKIERIHMIWEVKDDYYAYEMAGITKVSFEGDCVAIWGEADKVEELDNKRKRLIFHDDTYQYSVILNQYGMVAEVDCQYFAPMSGTRDGDFIVKGDTLIRYLGDYEKKREISLPSYIRTIAKNAFTLDGNAFNMEYVQPISLKIPKNVSIQEDAFANCGKMGLTFEEGRTVIEQRSFAHLVDDKSFDDRKSGWIRIELPDSLKRLEPEAFAVGSGSLSQYWSKMEQAIQPVTVTIKDNIEYIGDNSLWGTIIGDLPKKLKYLGKGITYGGSATKLVLPDGLEEMSEDALYIMDKYVGTLEIPASLKKIGESPFGDAQFNKIKIDKNNTALKVDKASTLLSKDGKILYYFDDFREDVEREDGEIEIYKAIIPQGVEVIAKNAIGTMVYGYAKIILPASIKQLSRTIPTNAFSVIYVLQGKAPVFKDSFSESSLSMVSEERVVFRIQKSEQKKLYQNLCTKKLSKKFKRSLWRCIGE